MDPTIGSAGIKATGSITRALLNRYRPAGVARTGSPEDRAQVYRRFLDAITANTLPTHWVRNLHEQGYGSKDELVAHLLTRQVDANIEMLCALDGVRLCAPEYVIKKAEEVAAVWAPNTETEQQDFPALLQATTSARMAFLDVARHDLNYEPKKWNMLARWKERRYLKKSQDGARHQNPTL
ncbi:hypothetical protein ACIOEZ_34190 [Streptomyces sp. NPDC087866]|uniref:hypothetical protein n=1 Tax=Streptomyces sp. NPDC087866 TaxID=3365815 RepID=UPI00382BE7B6